MTHIEYFELHLLERLSTPTMVEHVAETCLRALSCIWAIRGRSDISPEQFYYKRLQHHGVPFTMVDLEKRSERKIR